MKKQIPITLITGFLGSGKSTLINKILKEKSRIKFGLVVNEFGDIPIESQVVEASSEQIVELANGCMCCVIRKDLLSTIEGLLIKTPQIEHILLEASGLSDPLPIASTFLNNDLGGKLRFDTIICVVDAENYPANKKKYAITAKQIQFADFILISKIKKTEKQKLKHLQSSLKTSFPGKILFEWTNALNLDLLIDVSTTDHSDIKALEIEEHHHAHNDRADHPGNETHNGQKARYVHQHESVETLFFKTRKILEINAFGRLMNNLPGGIVRAKGFLRFEAPDAEECKYILQYVGGRFTLETKTWNQGEARQSALIFIGKNFNKELLYSQLKACEAATCA